MNKTQHHARTWTIGRMAEFGGPSKGHRQPAEFIRRAGGLYYRQWADAHGKPMRGAGRLWNPDSALERARFSLHALQLLQL